MKTSGLLQKERAGLGIMLMQLAVENSFLEPKSAKALAVRVKIAALRINLSVIQKEITEKIN